MREILFKAKGQTSGRWYEGLLTRIDKDVCHIKGKHCEEWICDPSTICQYTGLHDATKWEELSEKEKQQFLSEWNYEEERKNQKGDWKGRKIWENDIVRDISIYLSHKKLFESGHPGHDNFEKYREYKPATVVKFSLEDVASCGCCYPYFVGSGFKANDVNLHMCEVLGNIFDNADLLEREESAE